MWLRKHQATLNLDKVTTLNISLKDRKGTWGKRNLSLEPENSTFLFNGVEDNNFAVFTTKVIYNNEARGTLKFKNDLVPEINFSFDTLNMVDWENGVPSMKICETTLEVPTHILSNHKIESIVFINTSGSHLGSRASLEEASKATHPPPRPARQAQTSSGLPVVQTSWGSGQMTESSSGNFNPKSEMLHSHIEDIKLSKYSPKT